MASIYDWSLTAANNGSADADINFAEGQAPSTVNNSAREMMARLAELRDDLGGGLTAAGTANALTVTANSAFTVLTNGRMLAMRIALDNTGAATLNVNGIGAKSIRKMLATGESALTGAELQATGIYLFKYSTALDAAAGGWLVLNPTPADQTSFVTLTGTQILTNKTLTSPTINTPTIATPTITGGTSANMTLTGAALNGTLGATTPSTVAGTSGTFSSTVTCGGSFVASVTTLLLGPSAAGAVQIRPNGIASSTGQVLINSTGAVTINGTLTVTG